MIAILKREIKSYFTTYTGYIFLTFILLSTGIYSWFVNFKNQNPNFEYVVYNLNFLFLIAVPVLTMRIFAEEHKQKTDKLLYTLPLSAFSIVMGKYLAATSILFIGCVAISLIPLILSLFGSISLVTCFSTVFGFFLLGATLIAVGMFISSLSENLIVSSVVTFLVFLISYLSSTIVSAVTNFEIITSIISSISFFDRLIMFVTGIFDLTSVVYYISVSALFIFFTVLSVERRRCNR